MEIEDCIYFLTTHLFEDIKRDSFFVISAHNEFHGAVSDTVVVATVIVGNVLETHIMMPRLVVLFCFGNDTPFLQLHCRKEYSISLSVLTRSSEIIAPFN